MIVGSLEDRDVSGAQFSGIGKSAPAPAERLAAKRFDQQVCHQPRMTAVAVRKRMDGDQLMVQPHGDFIGRLGFMLYPVPHVIEERRRFYRYPVGVNADVSRRAPKRASPFPHLAEHPLVQRQREADV